MFVFVLFCCCFFKHIQSATKPIRFLAAETKAGSEAGGGRLRLAKILSLLYFYQSRKKREKKEVASSMFSRQRKLTGKSSAKRSVTSRRTVDTCATRPYHQQEATEDCCRGSTDCKKADWSLLNIVDKQEGGLSNHFPCFFSDKPILCGYQT